WAQAHPSLHLAADHDGTNTDGPLQVAMEQLAEQISGIIGLAVAALGGTPPEGEGSAEAIDPLVFGVVGAVFGAVRRWLTRPEQRISAELLERYTADSVWYVLQGHARTWGVELDPDVPLEELLTAALA
ncbi:MAG: TetR/AcrR family transcriptional regulator, partial [Nocardioides sp.]|nr:TetR/AcrR family transcriptional regulator [Nocardioides sp.]